MLLAPVILRKRGEHMVHFVAQTREVGGREIYFIFPTSTPSRLKASKKKKSCFVGPEEELNHRWQSLSKNHLFDVIWTGVDMGKRRKTLETSDSVARTLEQEL